MNTNSDIYREQRFNVPVRHWLPIHEIEQGAMEQLRNAASHPEALHHIAVMPDCHQGYGIPVGSIMLTNKAVIPNAVGVDIGCGVAALNTGLPLEDGMDKSFWRNWSGQVARDVPTGFSVQRSRQKLGELETALRARPLQPLLGEKAAVQLGTLGGGNHFMEAGLSDAGEIWLVAHSGSRHTGLRIADHYHKMAVALKPARGLDAPDSLASLPIDDQTGRDYLLDMDWAARFAAENRARMLTRMAGALGLEMSPGQVIEVPHNLAWLTGDEVTHRKGATPARKGQLGIIPGSMGTPSYIVEGLGNPDSFESCSHGAGRKMSRSAARSEITEAEFATSLAGTYSKASMRYVDEAPGAYKDIDVVMERQSDLVSIVHRLTPIITLKGDSRAKED
jgi:tRNA-splicing ligase RtcB (3'-phosphate/5'-hydroxy nucleic acid ligase)